MEEEQYLTSSSDTDSESSSSDDESTTTTTTEVGDVASVTQPELHLMSFLKGVFKEAGSFADDDFRLLTVAVHAVMLHDGFVCFVPVFPPPNRCRYNGTTSTIRVTYTLPEVLDRGSTDTETVILFFDNSENFVNIRGSLSDKEPVVHLLSLNRKRFAPPFDLAFVNSDMIDARIKLHGSSFDQYPENEIFEFRRLVNDALVYPLLIDLRQKAGLLLPPCFMRLPPELKQKILELVDGVDIAKVAGVCSELRNLCADDDLWKRKCAKDFGLEDRSMRGSWKKVYEQGHMIACLSHMRATGHRRLAGLTWPMISQMGSLLSILRRT